MAYLDNNGLSHLWSKIVNLFNKRIEVSETAPTEEENKIWLQPMTTNAGAVDYIVEEGISDIWTYRKWNSGITECWGRYTASGINAASHNLSGYWYSDIIEILLPFDFLSIGYYQVDGGSEDRINFVRDYGVYSSGNKIGFRICGHESEATNVNISIYVSVKGKWK